MAQHVNFSSQDAPADQDVMDLPAAVLHDLDPAYAQDILQMAGLGQNTLA